MEQYPETTHCSPGLGNLWDLAKGAPSSSLPPASSQSIATVRLRIQQPEGGGWVGRSLMGAPSLGPCKYGVLPPAPLLRTNQVFLLPVS